ncbi:MAG: class I SAM-dependent rRNA methyltransferase [Lachnospiraceae bacterium]|jgi:23S rRNA (cytosine1962-C5)-methyltransferase|nr:class I SAM-dependent rRNA methyltransferase [Lachnospiraceae bacterium]
MLIGNKSFDTSSQKDLAVSAKAVLKKREGRTLKAGGLWVYDNEIDRIEGDFENGDILTVEDFDGYFMGYGFISLSSKIRIRVLARRKEDLITPAFLKERVRSSWEYRKHVIDTSSCRVIFGEADFLPGLTVDKYEDVLVVESLALGSERIKGYVLTALEEVLAEDGIKVRGIYERSDAKVREKEGLERFKGFLTEPFETKVPITENGIRYIVDVENGQKTGFFLDQKDNRRAIHKICRGADVLDCFTHTGSFGLNAAIAGASHVLSVDASDLAIEQARENAALNGLDHLVDYQVADVFELLPALAARKKLYDVVILDPPAFTKSRNSVKAAARGYREINLRGMKLIKDGGFLVTCSCSHFMDPDLFAKTIAEAARDARKRLRQVEFRTQAPDHPILWASDESYYLKFYIFQVTDEK